ncbi:hypothetical protein [Shewanella algae]|uniref:hypothetical protein n=1 Tax=Shewanella algae TaxID=38313 RepID=UPI0034D5A35B
MQRRHQLRLQQKTPGPQRLARQGMYRRALGLGQQPIAVFLAVEVMFVGAVKPLDA